jgi:hypothetical protein
MGIVRVFSLKNKALDLMFKDQNSKGGEPAASEETGRLD